MTQPQDGEWCCLAQVRTSRDVLCHRFSQLTQQNTEAILRKWAIYQEAHISILLDNFSVSTETVIMHIMQSHNPCTVTNICSPKTITN